MKLIARLAMRNRNQTHEGAHKVRRPRGEFGPRVLARKRQRERERVGLGLAVGNVIVVEQLNLYVA